MTLDSLIDSSVLIDIGEVDSRFYDWSDKAIKTAGDEGRLVVNQVVIAELARGFEDLAALARSLPPGVFEREDLPWEAARRAAPSLTTGAAVVREHHFCPTSSSARMPR